nr:tRNA (adenosine(37)-N6)-dimethylallyltransferase MiaA [Lachnospiraceae bacterium]
MLKDNSLIVISGPTAAGKTDISIELAKKINGAIISADSMQVYKGMDVGTAKITRDEMQGIKHYMIDILEPADEFNVYIFKELVKKCIEQIRGDNKVPILVGGTGFYIQAVTKDVDFTENETDTKYREMLMDKADKEGAKALHKMLEEVDPKASKEIHENNVKRVIRALEYYKETGMRISEHNDSQRDKESAYDLHYFVITCERSVLYDRINRRVDIMREGGLLKEMIGLLLSGVNKNMTSMK